MNVFKWICWYKSATNECVAEAKGISRRL
jgi:hypothetical protein